MESRHTLETEGEAYPLEPDFVEERTLRSARQVVPLEQVETTGISRRPLLLISALVISLVLGACTSLAIVYLERRQTQQIDDVSSQSALARTEGKEPVPSQGPAVNKEVASIAPDAPEVTSKPEQGNKVAPGQGSKALSRRIAPLTGATSSYQNPMISPEADRKRNDLETRPEVRREEGRPRRAAVGSDRSRGASHDLFRIREIFEGRRRPD